VLTILEGLGDFIEHWVIPFYFCRQIFRRCRSPHHRRSNIAAFSGHIAMSPRLNHATGYDTFALLQKDEMPASGF
jgi:hypothetical protein